MTQPSTIPAPYIFLSYASIDRVQAVALADTLEQAGVRVWLDRSSIAGGTSWGSEIVEGIKGCAALLILCSDAAMQSRNVKQEIQLAWRYERAYVPLLLEPVSFPEHVQYFLEGWQWVELLDQPASVWLPVLLRALARLGLAPLPLGAAPGMVAAPVPPATAHVAITPAAGQSAFVGREAELGKLRTALDASVTGQGRLVLLAGEPGIGKTRLAQELVGDASGRGCLVLWGRCWEGEGAPAFFPWVEALGAYARSQEPDLLRRLLGAAGPDLAGLVPAIRALLPDLPSPAPAEPEQARFRIFDGVTTFLISMTVAQPVVLVLDDLHWADKPSLLLLQFLLRQLGGMRLLVLGTYRDTDLDRTLPLGEMLTTLRREPAFKRIAIGGLSEAGVLALLEMSAGHILDTAGRALAAALHRETEGNPLFVGETLRHLAETGGIVQEADRWRVTAASIAELGIPEGVREVIGRRLSRLSEGCNELLGIAAVMGREFDVDVLERVSGQPVESVDRALAEAVTAAVVAEPATATGRYRFTHALIRETLLQELSMRRRVRLHRQLAEALTATYGVRAEVHAAELAHHFAEAAGNNNELAAQALHWGTLAGQQAEAQTAWEEAARQYERCLTVLADMASPPEDIDTALLVALGRCQRNSENLDNFRPAWLHLMQAVALYRERGNGAGLARAVLECQFIFADQEPVIPLVEEALTALGETEPELRYRLLIMRAGIDLDSAAETAAQAAIVLGEQRQYPSLRGFKLNREYIHARNSLRLDVAERLLREQHAEALRTGDSRMVLASLGGLAVEVTFQGRLDDSMVIWDEYRAACRRGHLLAPEQNALAVLAGHALFRGESDRVNVHLAGLQGQILTPSLVRTSFAEMTTGPDASLLLDPSDPSLLGALRVHLHASHARVHFNLGDHAAARMALAAWAELLPRAVSLTYRVPALGIVDECLPAIGDAALVEQLYTEVATWDQMRIADIYSARGMDRIRGALALRLDRFDAAEAHYRTGLGWAEQERCPIEQARCLEGLAEAAGRRDQHAAAQACFARAAALFEAHGAVFYLKRLRARQAALI